MSIKYLNNKNRERGHNPQSLFLMIQYTILHIFKIRYIKYNLRTKYKNR